MDGAAGPELLLSKSTVGRIWKAFRLRPHLVDSLTLSNESQFIGKVRDMAGLYLDSPEKALVLCVDEKSCDPSGIGSYRLRRIGLA